MMIIESRMIVVNKAQVAYHFLYDLKKFIEEKVIHPFTFNLRINDHRLDFSLSMHTMIQAEWRSVSLNFSVFVLSNGRTEGFLLVEDFLEHGFGIDVDEIVLKDALFKKLRSEDTTHLSYMFINPSHFKTALESLMLTSYDALYEGQDNTGFIYGLIN